MEYVDLNVGKIDKSKTFIDIVKNYTKKYYCRCCIWFF
jgi:hypothetical protein